MKTSTSCSCHSAPDPCTTGVLERPCYYPGQLLTPAEMTLEQQYFRDKLRRHNRLLHGWGVVCGAAVCLPSEGRAARDDRHQPPATERNPQAPDQPGAAKSKPWKVCVTPGYILGPYGDEILIDREQIIDLRTCGQTGVTGEHGESPDPWCVDVYIQREPGPLYVAVRYQEVKTRPVRVQPAGCGCDETQCVDSRCRDGYEICALTECPPSHENPRGLSGFGRGPLPDCPECPADPWVVLARVDVDADGTITGIDNCACRRMVVSFASVWWQCSEKDETIAVETEDGGEPRPGSNLVLVARTRELLPQAAVQADLGDGVSVKSATVSADRTSVKIEAHVETNAVPGPRPLTIKDPATNRVVGQWSRAFQIAASSGGAETQEVKPKPTRPKRGGATGGKEPA